MEIIVADQMKNEVAPLSLRERIDELEAKMKALPQLEIPVKHYFADGRFAICSRLTG